MSPILDIEEIRTLLPHRFPMLMVDRMLELTPGKRAVGVKNVTINEPFFTGHFPDRAIMPGVLILEAMAQVSGVMMLAIPDQEGYLAYLAGVDKAKFRKPVVPGDILVMEVSLLWLRGTLGRVSAVARVDGGVVAECELLFALKKPAPIERVYTKLDRMRGSAGDNARMEGDPTDARDSRPGDSSPAGIDRGDADCE